MILGLCLGIGAVGAEPGANKKGDTLRGVPLKPDPPIAVDGDLSDWDEVPAKWTIGDVAQVVWGRGAWRSATDMSGVVQLAWRNDNLLVAARVKDDRLSQTQRGDGIWKGDHVELYLDMQPDLEPQRQHFGKGQFQIALSPGNFQRTGDPLVDCPPEAYVFRPLGTSAQTIKVAARRTSDGWTLEAAVPWSLLGVKRPGIGTLFRFELGLSDTDSPEPKQESLLTITTAPWSHQRGRLILAALAGSDGRPPAMVRRVPVFTEVRLPLGDKKVLFFDAPPIPQGRDAVLSLNARMDTPKVSGHTPALTLTLNGTRLDGRRLVNKPIRATARGGQVYSMAAGERFTTYYAPDFRSPDMHPYYGLLGGLKACAFQLRVTDLLHRGKNELVVANQASTKRSLVAADARIEFRILPTNQRKRRPAPTDPLAVFEPRKHHSTDYRLKISPDQGVLQIDVAGQTFEVRSRFSTPEGKWVAGSNGFFRIERRILKTPEAVIVRSTFTNLTDKHLPVMQRHEVMMGKTLDGVWLAGLRRPVLSGQASEPANPTTLAVTQSAGIGMLAMSDVMRIHVTNYALDGVVGIADNHLALKPGGHYTATWAVIPVDRPDYWRFLNTARRLMEANFTIPGAFCFLRASPTLTGRWSDKQIRDFLVWKDARYACASIGRYKGRYAHGTAFQLLDPTPYIRAFQRRRRLVPKVQNLVYFHCFLDTLDESPKRFADARVLRPDGSQADYGKPYQRIFFPTSNNSYGPAVAKNVGIIFDKIGADGVYWDEHEYSAYRYHYGKPWDGVSCDVDPQRMTIIRLKSSVTLLSAEWRTAMAKRILAHGPLVGNGAPYTRAMTQLKFPCFVETGSITNCMRAHFYSPIALGDHLTERSEEDAYRVMLGALDYGCVYHWYNDMTVIPTHHHLVRYMYPITPMELHAGYIIGQERIVTKKSGLFGWGDDAEHEVHVFDQTGREVSKATVPLVRRDGRTYSEIRLPEDWSAAIVRR